MPEIERDDFNLNISRYVSSSQAAQEIDLQAAHAEMEAVEWAIAEAKQRHNNFLAELRLTPLP